MNKQLIIQTLNSELRKKELEYHSQIEGIRNELANDSKNSAGDKYETSRAMAQQEIEQLSVRLQEVKRQFNLLQSLPSNSKSEHVEVGSLVTSTQGIYFIGIPFGMLTVENETIYVISPTAPLAQLLLQKKIGNQIQQGGKQIVIVAIN